MSSEDARLSKFLENFSGIPLQHRKSKSCFSSWVFWREYDGSQNISSSADLATTPLIQEKIISALSHIAYHSGWFVQFWAPVTVDGGRRVLSTSGQPFAVNYDLSNDLAMYRLYSEKYKYNINFDDVNQQLLHLNYEGDHMIIDGGPASAFLNRLPYVNKLQWIPSKDDCYDELNLSFMLPICFPSQSSSCIGVLELTLNHERYCLEFLLLHTFEALKEAGLDVFTVQDLIPYNTVNGLKLARDEIQEALKVVCESHNLTLAQVWIAYEDKSNVPFSYSLEDTQTKQLLGIKLTGYLYAKAKDEFNDFEPYFRLSDVISRAIGDDHFLVTIQDYKSRYISTRSDMFVDWDGDFSETSTFTICLRSNDTGDFNYAFEFIWTKHSTFVHFLEALLLTLKRCLPSFNFASGAEIGDEVDVIEVETDISNTKIDKTKRFNIFQPKTSEKGKKPMVVDYVAPSKKKHNTTKIEIPHEEIVKQFGKIMNEAATSLGGNQR